MTFDNENDDDAPERCSTDEQHAPFAIVRYLDALQLNPWSHTLMLWLGQDHGLGWHIAPEPSPVAQVHNLLAHYVVSGEPLCASLLLEDITRLPFLQYRATLDAKSHAYWQPLETPFIEFGRDASVPVVVWRDDDPCSEREQREILEYLLQIHQQGAEENDRRGDWLK